MNLSNIFSHLQKKIANFIFKDDSLAMLKFSLFFFFSFIPFRIMGLARVDLLPRFMLGFILLVFVFKKANITIPRVLDSWLFQIFFYFCLVCDEKLKSLKEPVIRVAIVFLFFLLLVFLLFSEWLSLFSLLYFLFVFSTYKVLKYHFANPFGKYCFVDMKSDLKLLLTSGPVTWVDMVKNMSATSTAFFNCPIQNKLNSYLSSFEFRFLPRRIVSDYPIQ